MNNIKTKLFLSFLFCTLVFETASGQIDIVFSADDGTTFGTDFDVDVGTTQTILVVAVETTSGTGLSTDGLLGFGFEANANATSGTAASFTNFTTNPGFVLEPFFLPSVTLTPSSADVVAGGISPNTGTSVLLGDFDISVTAPGSTVFTFEDRDPDPARQDFGTAAESLDGVVFQGNRNFSFTINAGTAIPEPSGKLLIGVSMLASMMRRKRNRSYS